MSTSDIRRAFGEAPASTLLSTGLGAGLFPVAPGTAGSAEGLALAWFLGLVLSRLTGSSVAASVGLLMSGLFVALVGVPVSTRAARALGARDPGCIVIDEIAGQLLSAVPVPLFRYASPGWEASVWVASFLLFRLFDIWKPGWIHRLQDLPEGWGIVVDDVAAGVAAALATALFAWFVPARP
ncbi:MAG TPA: phosphatidylglycerophosphatase A [Thermoanaerobaculia bacterium]|nr:phosphatidylglycerophosphatase A [Thermoanaerobaculia bacterium]